MRIYSNCYDLMSEMGRNLWEMGAIVNPKSYQNKVIEGNEDFSTRELICEQYCLMSLDKSEALFAYDKRSKEWADAEFKERVKPLTLAFSGLNYVNPGDAWKIREDLWKPFLNREGKFDYTYNQRLTFIDTYDTGAVTNITRVIEELKRNPDTRQAILPIFNLKDVYGIGGAFRIPCSMYYDFLIRDNAKGEKQLNICYHQRSSDFVTHFGNDVYLAWKLMEYMAEKVGVKPGYLYHTIDSIHSYKKDWSFLKTSVGEFL